MTDDVVPVRRALLSVSDKAGLVEFGRFLAGQGAEILSTGGTARALREAGVPVKDVSDHTGFPEILDGRVKTLVPQIHGGLLGRRDRPPRYISPPQPDQTTQRVIETALSPQGVGLVEDGQYLHLVSGIDRCERTEDVGDARQPSRVQWR